MKKLMMAAAVIALAFVIAACGGDDDDAPAEDAGPVVIGAAVAQTGLMNAYDGDPTQALQLAVDRKNAEGGIDGREIELLIEDYASEVERARTVAEALVNQGADMIVTSCDYDFALPAAQVAEENDLVNFSLCAQSLLYGAQGVGPHAYTVSNATVSEANIAAEWAHDQGWENAFLLIDPTTAYSEETCTGFREPWTDLGGQIVGEDSFENDDPQIASQINTIRNSDPQPDFIRLCSYVPGAGMAIRQMRAAGIDVPIIGNASMDGAYWLDAVPGLDDFYYPAHASIYGDDPNPDVNEFVEAYETEFGAPPATAYAIFGQALLEAYALAVERAGTTDSAEVAGELNEFSGEELLPGPTTFSEEVRIELGRPMAMIEVQNGTPSFLEEVEPEEPAEFEL